MKESTGRQRGRDGGDTEKDNRGTDRERVTERRREKSDKGTRYRMREN